MCVVRAADDGSSVVGGGGREGGVGQEMEILGYCIVYKWSFCL